VPSRPASPQAPPVGAVRSRGRLLGSRSDLQPAREGPPVLEVRLAALAGQVLLERISQRVALLGGLLQPAEPGVSTSPARQPSGLIRCMSGCGGWLAGHRSKRRRKSSFPFLSKSGCPASSLCFCPLMSLLKNRLDGPRFSLLSADYAPFELGFNVSGAQSGRFPGVTIEQAQDVLGHVARGTAMDQA